MEIRDRVRVEADGTFQVSMPGKDVKTATIAEMAFDARFASIGQAVSMVTLLPRRVSTLYDGAEKTVLFKRTFRTPPMFLFAWNGPDGTYVPPYIVAFDSNVRYLPLFDQVDAQIGNDRVKFINYRHWSAAVRTTKVRWKAFY